MTPAPIDQAIDVCFRALSSSPAGLFSDFDGTLSPVAPTPDDAVLAVGAEDALRRLVPLVDTVAIVTGRASANASERVGVPGIRYVGNHGLEELFDGVATIQPGARTQVDAIGQAIAAIEKETIDRGVRDGLVFEDKRLSGSVHYRLAPDHEAAYQVLRELADREAARHDLVVTGGKLVLELRPKLTVNKGTAVAQLIDSRQLRGAVMLGDDVTDVDAFRAIRRARQDGLTGVSVGVMTAETHPSVLETADVCLSDVSECVVLLETLAGRLSTPVRP